ncbi:MAG: HAD-IA family hydrolase [Anaerolineae bacterium]|jgi:putative hydrolase of the HAD superfamily|nr:HAD-IA family hydrolase [Anaerolineae bacterium]
MPIRAILFDLDDTLIDWSGFAGNWYDIEPRHLRYVYDHVTHTVGGMRVNFEGFIEEFNRRTGEAWRNARHSMASPHIGHLLVDTIAWLGIPRERLDLDSIVDAYRWDVVEGTLPFPEVHGVLETLSQRGLAMGLITNSYLPMRMRDAELRGHGLMPFFGEHRYSAADLGYLKPHANVFIGALERMGIPPAEAVFVGDNLTADIMGGRGVGMRTVWRMTDKSASLPSVNMQPDLIVSSLDQMLPKLEQWMQD